MSDRPPLVVSIKDAAGSIGCSTFTIRRLIERGSLEKVQICPKRIGVTWESLVRLARGTAA